MHATGNTVVAGAENPPRMPWLGRIALLSAASASMVGLYGMGLTIAPLAREFAATPNVTLISQMVAGIVGLAYAVAAPVAGRLIDRFGYRTVLLIGMAMFTLLGAVPALLNDLYLILASRVLFGFIIAGVSSAGMTGIAQLAEPERTRMFGIQSVIGGLTATAFFPLLGAVVKVGGWRGGYGLHLLYLLPILAILSLPKNRPATAQASGVQGASRTPVPWDMLGLALLAGIGLGIPTVFAPFVLANIGITDPQLVSIALIAASLGSMSAGVLFGWIGPKLSSRWLFTAGLLVSMAGFLCAGFAKSLPLFVIGAFACTTGVSLILVNVYATVSRRVKGDPGRVMGMTNAALFGSLTIFPLISASVGRLIGPAGMLLAFGVICGLVAGLFIVNRQANPAVAAEIDPVS